MVRLPIPPLAAAHSMLSVAAAVASMTWNVVVGRMEVSHR